MATTTRERLRDQPLDVQRRAVFVVAALLADGWRHRAKALPRHRASRCEDCTAHTVVVHAIFRQTSRAQVERGVSSCVARTLREKLKQNSSDVPRYGRPYL